LLGHIALLAQFENMRDTGRAGMHAAKVAALAQEAGVSSRNTAEAFLREMVAYGFAAAAPHPDDQRIRWLAVTPYALEAVSAWAYGNLATLDAFDGGERAKTFMAAPQALGVLQPIAARMFLTLSDIRNPGPTFALFDLVDEGGGIMDRLISTCELAAGPDGRRATAVAAMTDFGDHLRISRSHLTRKLREAEAQGALGWTGPRGRSPIWISDAFVAQYIKRIAAELAPIEAGYQAAFPAAP
jgi:DNA-binding MarR family transcriptional regulator